ncbi:MipA/OmpV family protein [Roseateles oligotrophus]|uniref:MipA/OmpV family protein n=1 Tax=Roseateles oligotrophus TaxID=1769250 RepID=A0ABT2YG60_9BURK|nr:MipA/OmpV family protein [Roseateles oligotrophus]MCV2369009.1 MipA/OmpV family protein [Roseateles oligotrophus]
MRPNPVFSILALLLCAGSNAAAQDQPQDPVEALLKQPVKALLTVFELGAPHAELRDQDFRYLLGATLQQGPEYWGAKQYKLGLKPVWAMRWGKWRFSSSGGAALMGFGQEAIGPGAGASRDLFDNDRLRLGLGLRLDGGRGRSDEGVTAGLPEVRRTLRGRAYSSYALLPGWHLSGALSLDLAGRAGGAIANLDLSHVLYRNANSELLAGIGLSAGDSRYMRSYFGVPAGSPGAARLRQSFEPAAGLRDVNFKLGYTYAFSRHWMGFAGVGVSRLLGPAAASPITQQTLDHNAGLSLAYRN